MPSYQIDFYAMNSIFAPMESQLTQLSAREIDIFERVVDIYLETGTPVASGHLSKQGLLKESLSSATIRNVFQDLEYAGLIEAPHVSAGRRPTLGGLNMYIDRFVSVEQIDETVRDEIDALNKEFNGHADLADLVEKSSEIIGRMTKGMTMIAVPDQPEIPLEQLRFIRIGGDTIMAVLIYRGGKIENRIIEDAQIAAGASLESLSNYMTDRVFGKTLTQIRAEMDQTMQDLNRKMSTLEATLAEQGVQTSRDEDTGMFVYKASEILGNDDAAQTLETLRLVYEELEQGQVMHEMVRATKDGQGVQVFIGTEHPTFQYEGLSTLVSPILSEKDEILGAFAYIVPQRAQYRRIIPAIDYTSRMLGRLIHRL